MKLGQPKAARNINSARVLNELRQHENLSKAMLSRTLGLSKPSTGEIVDELLLLGVIRNRGKLDSKNGRKAVALEIIPDSRFVLAVDIGARNTSVALCTLLGEIVKMERIPTLTDKSVEQFCVEILKSCIRTIKLVDSSLLLGVGVTVCASISAEGVVLSCPYLPWKNIPLAEALEKNLNTNVVVCHSTRALVLAEKIVAPEKILPEETVLYIDWGDRINSLLIHDGKPMGENSAFGHIRVAQTGLCSCGKIGCLEAVASTWALSQRPGTHLKDLWNEIPKEVFKYFAHAINTSFLVSGCTSVIIGGDASTINEEGILILSELCPGMKIQKSSLGEKANLLSAAQGALDEWFYHTSMLEEVKKWI